MSGSRISCKGRGFLFFTIVFAIVLLMSSCKTLYRHFDFPQLDGPYAVGSEALDLVDASRQEIHTSNHAAKREFMAQIWYPVDPEQVAGKTPLLYGPEIEEVLRSLGGTVASGFNYLHSVPTRTFADVPLSPSKARYPVLLYSPGNLSTRFQSLSEVGPLVSRGYVVVGFDHPYTSAVVRFPDGRAVRPPDASVKLEVAEGSEDAAELNVRVGDVLFALDTLQEMNERSDSLFRDRLDLSRVGAFGHSLGGATVLQAAAVDSRIKAVFAEEGGVWGSVIDTGIRVPLFYMQAFKTLAATSFGQSGIKSDETSKQAFAAAKEEFMRSLTSVFEKSTADRYYLSVRGFNHFSFSDAPLYSDYLAGDIGYARAITLINDYLEAFFDRYLFDVPSPLLDGPSPHYPEVGFLKNTSQLFGQAQ